ncbi:type II 3-dehydroquinate dehydratase [uncultured Parolsenella sp.]|uniref:type II 3-dehydroquinate dehydratase n=1 Tax=uncultured Parolsenella sp. TaxID=2083008 RepID=UPI0027D9A016|nr:type II 3-dehydroquinate dehydratase [uncultured Parolsenella sp.]
MNYGDVAADTLIAVGGAENIRKVMTCLTRLRLTLVDPTKVDSARLQELRGVLGVVSHGKDGIEVVFGPSAIEGVAREFAIQSGVGLDEPGGVCVNPLQSMPEDSSVEKDTEERTTTVRRAGANPIIITPGRRRSYRAQQQAAIDDERLGKEDIDALKAFLDGDAEKKTPHLAASAAERHAVLVINGPNINMLGIREPGIYGKADYAALVRTCKDAAHEAGFDDIRCFQSNHEGSIVDEIQAAFGTYDGIVINPAAYTHTSVAILDAVKAVSLPAVEVHISKVEEREDFRQVSFVRKACFETITGMGIEGYRKAILDLAAHLGV